MIRSVRPILLAALAVCVPAVYAGAQTPPPPMDFGKVEIKTTRLAPTFYTLEGQGGTTGALVGPDGVLLVDGTSDYDARVPGGPASSERFLRALAAEFAAAKWPAATSPGYCGSRRR